MGFIIKKCSTRERKKINKYDRKIHEFLLSFISKSSS